MKKTEKALFSWDFHSIWEMGKDNKHNKKDQVVMRICINWELKNKKDPALGWSGEKMSQTEKKASIGTVVSTTTY